MNKKLKKILIIALAVIVAAGAVWGGMTIARNVRKKPVNVYPVASLMMSDSWMDVTESSGQVSAENIQKIYISETQVVTDILVNEGDTVKKGQQLVKYDTTLSDIELKKAEIEVDRKKQDLVKARQDLVTLQNASASEPLEARRSSLEAEINKKYKEIENIERELEKDREDYVPTMPVLPLGNYTQESPRYINKADLPTVDEMFDAARVQQETEELPGDIYVVFVTVTGREYSSYLGMHFVKDETGNVSFEFFEAKELDSNDDSGYVDSKGITDKIAALEKEIASLDEDIAYVDRLLNNAYPRSEIAKMINEKNAEIKQLQLDIRVAEVELKKKQNEVNNGGVTSTIDGQVVAVRSVDEALSEGKALVEVSGGGGYSITASVNEFGRDSIQVGQTVRVVSYGWNYMEYEGQVVSIGDEPTENSGWSQGNNNVSWYPMTVFVDESAELDDGDYVEVQYNSSGSDGGNTQYLQNMYIREENGSSYVYVRGEDGLLEKRFIQTGKAYYGYATEVKSGLSMDEYIAFPYGTDVEDGAKTQEADLAELYGY